MKSKANVSFVIKLSEERIKLLDKVNGWLKFKEQAEKWSKLKIYKDNNEYVCTLAHSKLNDTEDPFRKSHRSCKRAFALRYVNSVTKFGEKNPTKNGKFLSVIFIGYLL